MIWQQIYLWLPGVFNVFAVRLCGSCFSLMWVYQFVHKCIFCVRKNLFQGFDQPNFRLAMVSRCIIWQKPHRWHFQTADSNAFSSLSLCLLLAENLRWMQSECVIFLHPFPMNMCMQTWLKLRYYRNNWRQLRYSFSHKLFLQLLRL